MTRQFPEFRLHLLFIWSATADAAFNVENFVIFCIPVNNCYQMMSLPESEDTSYHPLIRNDVKGNLLLVPYIIPLGKKHVISSKLKKFHYNMKSAGDTVGFILNRSCRKLQRTLVTLPVPLPTATVTV